MIIPTYEQLKKNKNKQHVQNIIVLLFMAYSVLVDSWLLLIIWCVYIVIGIINLQILNMKTQVRDKLKERYENNNNIILTENEFDNLFTIDSDGSSKLD